ncbi:MAG: hypothetical protein RLZZ480_797 [Candidatus Parcubacteria bacterium]|jgi:prepilin-type N-terminal cleavage/methylation domain-containing protein
MKYQTPTAGFTLIEMIISLGLFSVVVTVSVGALLMLVATNNQLQGEQSVMTNLSFALDSMTREMRTGTHYYCEYGSHNNQVFSTSGDLDSIRGNSTHDCVNGNPDAALSNYKIGLSFNEGGDSITTTSGDSRILYYFDKSEGKIFRKVGANAPESITSSDIYIKKMDLFVSGSDPLNGGSTETDQASVTIYIEASETSASNKKTYYLQTTVSQRTLDI